MRAAGLPPSLPVVGVGTWSARYRAKRERVRDGFDSHVVRPRRCDSAKVGGIRLLRKGGAQELPSTIVAYRLRPRRLLFRGIPTSS